MLRFILTRVSLVIPTFLGITLLAFFLIRLVPGDPIETMAGERGIDPTRHAELRKEFGFDQPIFVQYGIYLARVLQGDLGKSIVTRESVLTEFWTLFPATIELATCAILFALVLGLLGLVDVDAGGALVDPAGLQLLDRVLGQLVIGLARRVVVSRHSRCRSLSSVASVVLPVIGKSSRRCQR